MSSARSPATSVPVRLRQGPRSARGTTCLFVALVLVCAGASSRTDRVATAATSGSHAYTTLRHSLSFTSDTIAPAWSVYDNSHKTDPAARRTRVRSLVSVSDGALHVKSSGSSGSGLCLCGAGYKSTTPYGRWDVRARINANRDHSAAILLWPSTGSWPSAGEIDLLESWKADRSTAVFTVHYGAGNHQIMKSTTVDVSTFHTYSVEWTSRYIRYWIDGRLLISVTDTRAIPHGPMFLSMQAGPHGSAPSATSASLIVSSVKVFGP